MSDAPTALLDEAMPGLQAHGPTRTARWRAGGVIFDEGDLDNCLYVIHSGRVLARRIRSTSSTITDTVYASVPARVAKHLLGLAQRFGVQEHGAMRVPMELTQEQFAYLVGSSRESVNKALCDFAARGWIVVARNSILIKESEPLAARMHGARRTHLSAQ